jgi:hypothetical protein
LARFIPAFADIALGDAIQKLGSGGRAASFTGALGTLDMCLTSFPAASKTSSETGFAGRVASE